MPLEFGDQSRKIDSVEALFESVISNCRASSLATLKPPDEIIKSFKRRSEGKPIPAAEYAFYKVPTIENKIRTCFEESASGSTFPPKDLPLVDFLYHRIQHGRDLVRIHMLTEVTLPVEGRPSLLYSGHFLEYFNRGEVYMHLYHEVDSKTVYSYWIMFSSEQALNNSIRRFEDHLLEQDGDLDFANRTGFYAFDTTVVDAIRGNLNKKSDGKKIRTRGDLEIMSVSVDGSTFKVKTNRFGQFLVKLSLAEDNQLAAECSRGSFTSR